MEDKFNDSPGQHLAGISAFSARMKEFSYAKHAHEEYSIGVTLRMLIGTGWLYLGTKKYEEKR
ncbi:MULTISPECIES: hypothetical protein [unclassified Vibrio]|uniref:hypothetical protein n=1 Tax=unclassified Vibrio TaxID=2614977 RepID=UPI001929ED54|nr:MULTISPECIES: hypothetical protein [unclassified Vibrio]